MVLKAIHAQGGLMPASIHVFEAGWHKYIDCMSGTPGTARGSPYECHPSLAPFAYLLPTH